MHNMKDDRLVVENPEIDVVPAVNGKPQAGPDRIAGHARMAGLCYAVKMVDDFGNESPSGVDVVGCNKIKDLIEIRVSRIGDDQVFRRDRSSPREMMSDFIASASDDLWNSPRRYAASASSIFACSLARSASYSSIMRTPARTTASADGKFPLATCRAMMASASSPGV
jgi:hypothetical protein